MNRSILFFYCCCACIQLPAQQYAYTQYNSESGAPFDLALSIVQDQEGFLWVGSDHGLFQFDGIEFTNYSLQTKSNFIYQIEGSKNELYFINDVGLLSVDDLDSNPRVRTVLKSNIDGDNSPLFYPNGFHIDSSNRIWISESNHGVSKYQDESLKSFPFSKSTSSQHISIEEDKDGRIWILSPIDGLFQYNEENDSFDKELEIKDGLALFIHDNHLLIGSDQLRIYEIVGDILILKRTISMNNDRITAIDADHWDHIVVGTEQGKLIKLETLEATPSAIYGANEAHRVEQLNFGRINDIYITTDSLSDNDKIWICSETGLWLLQQRFFKTVRNLPMNNPIGIAIGIQEKVWVPMNYLYEISPEKEEFTAKTILNNQTVNSVAQAKTGHIWVSTSTPSVELLKYKDQRLVRKYSLHERGESIFSLYPDTKGNIWFCQAPLNKPIIGIAMIDSVGEIHYYDENKGFSSRVLAIKESSRGEIYAAGIGEGSYLYQYDPVNDRFLNISPELPFEPIMNFEAHDLTIDDRGIVWLATTDGLLHYDSEMITLVRNDLLDQEEVRGVTHYSNDNIWIATATKGLVFHQDNISTALGEQEGLPSVINAYRCLTTDKHGRLWAGTPEGLVYSRISAENLPYSNSPRIRKVIIGKDNENAFEAAELKIASGEMLTLMFTNLTFPAENVQYQYRLSAENERKIDLEEKIWLSNGKNNTLKITEEITGDYMLEIRAKQPGGYQWSVPSEIPLNIYLPWYLQSWFVYISVTIFIFIATYYFRFYIQNRVGKLQAILKHSNEKLASKEALLIKKDHEFEVQRKALNNASSNIQTLELFIKDIPAHATWNDIIAAMAMAVTRCDDINAFEIAFIENDEIIHRGYSDQERSGYTFRTKAFNTKTSLTCWSMANNKEVLIKDFESEHPQYIEEKGVYRFQSLIFIPFTLENDQPVALCAYSTRKNDFDNNDLIMFRVLAQFIQTSIDQELTKTA